MTRFTLDDFQGSVESVIAMLQALPPGSQLEVNNEWRRGSTIGGPPELFEFVEVQPPKS